MPALPNIPGVLKFNLVWRCYGDVSAQTIHYFKYTSGTPSSADCSTMASSAVLQAETDFGAQCANGEVGMESATCTDLSSASAGQGSGGTPWLGVRSGSPLAPGTAIVINHQIGRRYRGGKPRSYLPLGTASDLSGAGLWAGSFVSAVDGSWGAWANAMLGLGSGCTISEIANVSYYEGFTVVVSPTTGRSRNVPKLRATPLVDKILSHTANQKIGSQRRRNKAQ